MRPQCIPKTSPMRSKCIHTLYKQPPLYVSNASLMRSQFISNVQCVPKTSPMHPQCVPNVSTLCLNCLPFASPMRSLSMRPLCVSNVSPICPQCNITATYLNFGAFSLPQLPPLRVSITSLMRPRCVPNAQWVIWHRFGSFSDIFLPF